MTRDTWIVGGALVAALLIGAGLYYVDLEKTALPTVSYADTTVKVITEGTKSNVAERKNYKIVSQEQFAEIWGMAYGEKAPPVPQVDFSKKQVLALFAGKKDTAGYAISVKDISYTGTARAVAIVLSEPAKECSKTKLATAPFVMVEVSASPLPIEKIETKETAPCTAASQ